MRGGRARFKVFFSAPAYFYMLMTHPARQPSGSAIRCVATIQEDPPAGQ